jgi:photosystem II stability/assembly factor-like uncharacterized protein
MRHLSALLLALALVPGVARAQWTQTNGPGRAPALLVHSDGVRIQVGLDQQGVYLSTDQGASWAPSTGLQGATVTCFAQNTSFLFAGLQDNGTPGGVYRSSNGGASWQAVNTGLGERWIRSLLAVGDTVYAGDFASGVFRSTNNGGSWSPANGGIETESIGALARSGSTLFAAGSNNLYQSTNQGATWEFTNGGQFFPIAGMSAFGSQIYAGGFQGLIRSTNGGQSWSNRIDVLFIGSLDRLTSFALDGSVLYASTISSPGSGGSGVIRSNDQGLNWQPANQGIGIVGVNHLTLDGPRLVAAAPDKGVLISTNGGTTWQRRVTGLPPGGSVRELVGLGNTMYAGTQGDGVHQSTDGGGSWTQASSEPSAILANETVLSLLAENNLLIAGTAFHGMFRSTNGGTTWAANNTGLPAGVVQGLDLVRAGSNILLGTGAGLFYSTDNGLSWNPTILQDATIPAVTAADGFAYSVFISGISQFDGIYRSTNSGLSWTRVLSSLSTSFISQMAAEGGFVYATVFVGGLLRSTDHGTTWGSSPPAPGIGVFSLLVSLAADAQAGVVEVFAGTEAAGAPVYRSTDHGASWAPDASGLPAGQGIEALGEAGNFLFAATDLAGVWRRQHGGTTGVEPADVPHVDPLALAIAGANPVRGRTTIEFRLPESAPILLRLVDVAGRTVGRLASGTWPAGVHRVDWVAGDLPAGSYWLELATARDRRAAKLLLVK